VPTRVCAHETGTGASARPLRGRVDWALLRSRVADDACAAAFLVLVERLGVAPG